MITLVAGFADQTDADLFRAMRQLMTHDADQIQALYVRPHRCTPFYRLAAGRAAGPDEMGSQASGARYMARMPPWRLFVWVKLIEAVAQLRPHALRRSAWRPNAKIRHAIRCYYRMGRWVWLHEVASFLFRDRYQDDGRSVADHLGDAQDSEEEASRVVRQPKLLA